MLLAAAVDDAPALLHDGGAVSFGGLREAVATARRALAAPAKALVWLAADNRPEVAILHVAALAEGHVVALLPAEMAAERRRALLEAYRPEIVVGGTAPGDQWQAVGAAAGLPLWRRPPQGAIHPDLCLMLATSGSTGNPRFVRLSRRAVTANARQIAEALAITPDDRALLHLPLHYSFGLSVLHSHLLAGAPVVLAGGGLVQNRLWDLAQRHKATVLPAVPVQFDMLRRLDFERLGVPTLGSFIQAGGKLSPALVQFFAAFATARGGRFHVMYGQTEAAPRMAVMPAGEAAHRPDQAGRAVPGGRFEVVDERGRALPSGERGEIVYHGPNVMMGYAERREDLGRGDEMGERLATGDTGSLDADGYLTVAGRRGHFAKVDGLRLDLADVEAAAGGGAVAVAAEGRLVLFTTGDDAEATSIRSRVAAACGIHTGRVEVRRLPELPTLPGGKPDRRRLEALA